MKQGIHPEYTAVNAKCSCGNAFVFNSTMKKDINLDVCDKCHPFYTGKQRQVSTGGRIDKFNKRFGALSSK
ncbi:MULTISPECIES: 50S ribosomal protein L31 [Photobacterium]|uniref:Large ribosomal subunit protein bL31 n=1 Tax=Photobacterium halotolerans TaxID=265726 RepID=A0A7X4XWP8_9GAMM|nr:50S ribosomal protein L31 [Photobacterium halotolerans]NAW66287.1 50S ribosomal protein L31 [Photobacterium halotolerans]NAW88279.1 50S ribosomal protein L31 [Photobacterium halotolerans]NAX46454.1 50S ribosomal protein L31 [Photobacterium halotolerans]